MGGKLGLESSSVSFMWGVGPMEWGPVELGSGWVVGLQRLLSSEAWRRRSLDSLPGCLSGDRGSGQGLMYRNSVALSVLCASSLWSRSCCSKWKILVASHLPKDMQESFEKSGSSECGWVWGEPVFLASLPCSGFPIFSVFLVLPNKVVQSSRKSWGLRSCSFKLTLNLCSFFLSRKSWRLFYNTHRPSFWKENLDWVPNGPGWKQKCSHSHECSSTKF